MPEDRLGTPRAPANANVFAWVTEPITQWCEALTTKLAERASNSLLWSSAGSSEELLQAMIEHPSQHIFVSQQQPGNWLLGMCEGVILHVTYTERGERIRIIPARRAERHGQTTITAKMGADGTIVEVMSDGSERPSPDSPMRTLTEAEIVAAASADPDARPITPEELRTARRVPLVKTLRRALGLTQQEFSTRYRIPLGTLRLGTGAHRAGPAGARLSHGHCA